MDIYIADRPFAAAEQSAQRHARHVIKYNTRAVRSLIVIERKHNRRVYRDKSVRARSTSHNFRTTAGCQRYINIEAQSRICFSFFTVIKKNAILLKIHCSFLDFFREQTYSNNNEIFYATANVKRERKIPPNLY